MVAAVLASLAQARAHADARDPSALSAVVLDADTRRPVRGARVTVMHGDLELASGTTDGGGAVALTWLQPPAQQRASKAAAELRVEIAHRDYDATRRSVPHTGTGATFQVLLTPIEVIEVSARAYSDVFRPTTTLSGRSLQESVRTNVPETIAEVPGVAVAYNGPGAARPTIRGLGGDRVRMLEDGFAVGDLYWSASDHGVMVEPLSAHRVEVVRGPASLIYGANALGGAVNVVRDDIPAEPRDAVEASLGAQVESATGGVAQAGSIVLPAGPLSVRLEESVRLHQDVRTPRGEIPNTDMSALGGSAGLGWHPGWGLLGASVRYYENGYGVPGEFDGQLVPGGHPGGAAIEARRLNGKLRARYDLDAGIESLELGASANRYLHDEIEGVIDGQRALGASFQLDSLHGNFIVRHRLDGGASPSLRGATGVAISAQDLLAGGNSPGVRSGDDLGIAGLAFQQLDVGPVSLHAAVRYEHRQLSPDDTTPIILRTAERIIDRSVARRRFDLLSGSLAAMWEPTAGWVVGSTVARSSRAPNLQELYSDGPHLADFSFDIGTPGLPPEVGTGVDLFVLVDDEHLDLELAGFVNYVDDYVQYTPTLEMIRVFREGVRPRDTPVFEARNVDARFVGAEGTLSLRLGYGISLSSTLSYVWAERRDDSDPLPFIAPLHGKVGLRYELDGFFAGLSLSGAGRQSRVPRAVAIGGAVERPQEPTDGYALVHATAGHVTHLLGLTHTLTARLFNLTDRPWRDHLSRIKDVAPQMGLNASLTYELRY
ncbi:MAG: TonB-dependent receptor [Myxococcales bacterium]|nr:TonB-dependent receptor [Myxococcales bacterium]